MSIRPDSRPSPFPIPANHYPGENKERLTTNQTQGNLPTAPGSTPSSSSSHQVEVLERLIACIKAL